MAVTGGQNHRHIRPGPVWPSRGAPGRTRTSDARFRKSAHLVGYGPGQRRRRGCRERPVPRPSQRWFRRRRGLGDGLGTETNLMPRAFQRIQIYSVQDRRPKRGWVVRWSIDGRQRARSFPRKGEAERFRHELYRAKSDGVLFDPTTGEPTSWNQPLAELRLHEWARRWVEGEWDEWAPRTRKSAIEALARFIPVAVERQPGSVEELGAYLRRTLAPATEGVRDELIERWLDRHCLRVADIDKERLRPIVRTLMQKRDGAPLAPNTAARLRATCHACLLAAVEADAIETDPWPYRTKAQARRKAVRKKRGVDIRSLPDPITMDAAIDAMANDKPGSLVYQAMTAVAYYAGLRPSEVVMLRVRALDLPPTGWGRISVTEADDGEDNGGEPKTGDRIVPIPPVLVDRLRSWTDDRALRRDDLLFRTARGTRPNQQNWNRAWKRALALVGHEP
ncbi:MAG TPA: site-specific integrase, partial [Nocardioides sp.]